MSCGKPSPAAWSIIKQVGDQVLDDGRPSVDKRPSIDGRPSFDRRPKKTLIIQKINGYVTLFKPNHEDLMYYYLYAKFEGKWGRITAPMIVCLGRHFCCFRHGSLSPGLRKIHEIAADCSWYHFKPWNICHRMYF